MLADPELELALCALTAVPSCSGLWVRAIADEYLVSPPPGEVGSPQPLWAGGASKFGARYTQKGGAPALYFAPTPDVAMLEVEAAVQIGGRVQLTGKPPMTILTVNVHVRDVLDLCDPATQKALGTNIEELTGAWRLMPGAPTQRLGALAVASGRFDALRVPSAKDPAHALLVVFAERLSRERGTFCEVVGDGRLAQRIP